MTKSNKQKLRGGYYTPKPIASFLVKWATSNHTGKNLKCLEPSMGDGVFILEMARRLAEKGIAKSKIGKNIWGIELSEEELNKTKKRLNLDDFVVDNFNLISGDFFENFNSQLKHLKFDVILGNPPFIRYQNFPKKQQEKAASILKDYGFHPNKLTNAWLFFLLSSVQLLKHNGKIAMVIPAELLQVKYAAEARKFLSNFFHSITLLSFKKLVFEGVQQEIVLLLGEKDGGKRKGIDLIELGSLEDLEQYKDEIKKPDHFKPIDHSSDKWTKYFLDNEEILLLRKLVDNKRLKKIGEFAEVDVGIVTGKNDFFVLDRDTVKQYNLYKYAIPLIGRTGHLNGSIKFTKSDWRRYERQGVRSYLLNCQDPLLTKINSGLAKYIRIGESSGVHKGYKCSIRKVWYSVPSVWVPDAFLYRQIYDYPRLVANLAGAVPTDTIHRVKIINGVNKTALAASFLNSLTLAFSEVVGRSYGGGVLELEPNEAEELPIPFSDQVDIDTNLIDRYLKKNNFNGALDYVDTKLLREYLKLNENDISSLRNIRKKLSQRRMRRK